jgi:ATP-dependent DNA helicase PIF1
LDIHRRLQQIKGVPADVPFGGVSILAVGDLYQLPPVLQPALFSIVSDSYAALYRSGSLWKDDFELFELDEIMRQRGDDQFTQLLCRVRVNACTEDDIDLLQSRVVKQDDPSYPVHALHVYRTNKDVDARNHQMLNSIASADQQYIIKSIDTIRDRPTTYS